MDKNQFLSDDNLLALYLKEIGRSSPLTAKEEALTSEKVRQGDRKALDKLVKANLRFVVSVAHNYQHQGLPLSDLINEGNIGLIRAAKRFDEKKNFKFISYAVWWIRQAILQALAEQSRIVKLPLNRVGAIHKIGRAQCKLEQKYCRKPAMAEIACELNLNEQEICETIKIGTSSLSLDAPVISDEDSKFLDFMHNSDQESTDSGIAEISLQEEINETLDTLLPREKEIITLYFGIGGKNALTLEEIGERFNLTRERARQIKEKALKRLKHGARGNRLKMYRS
jgi:RNA polymerase primary sigma factor